MKCQQCLSPHGEIAEYRVFSDVINVKVCRRCADVARRIGIPVTALSETLKPQGRDHGVDA